MGCPDGKHKGSSTTGEDEALLHEQVRLFIAAGPNPKRAGATRVVGVA